MPKQQLNSGDVVKLKSGGPTMTVSEILQGDVVSCKWFDHKHEFHEATFHMDALELIAD